jgi:hypothetical protein
MDCTSISALDYLNAARRALRNSDDRLAFRRLNEDLERLPATAERLAFEFLALASAAVEDGADPARLTLFAVRLSGFMGRQRLPEYWTHFDKLLVCCLERIGTGDDVGPALTSKLALAHLRINDPERFRAVVEELRRSFGGPGDDLRGRILAEADEPSSQRTRRVHALRRRVSLKQQVNELSARSSLS